jgi:hypothetical protein
VFGDIWQTQKIYGSATAVDPADGSTTIGRGSEGHNRKAREGCAIEAVIQSEKAESPLERMSPDQEIGEDTARVGVTLLSPAGT